ncbi:MAG: peptidoglycan DD-metalloendopeptidase family protein [Bacteroidota bacterium]|nr:peptidoglycan DD-metalloendopeptidase family protein [Bacteroidota bacterium]
MDLSRRLAAYLNAHPNHIGKVVDFNSQTDRLYHFDLTADNTDLYSDTVSNTDRFSKWVNHQLSSNNCLYGIGGYMEHRTLYSRSVLFDAGDEPRRLHLGMDIWGSAGTPVYSPLPGTVHSFNDNDNFGDYGPTIILQHDLDGLQLYSLYGHLNRDSLQGLLAGKPISANQQIGRLGEAAENGHWPPHLHFQLMFDMERMQGDYPGVCRFSEKEKHLKNIPDPQLILQFPKAVND